MKKTLKKSLLTLLAIITMTVIFCFGASAATSGYYTYEVYNDYATITDVEDSIFGDVAIPSTLGGYPVTTIGEYAFYDCIKLTGITIPDSVTAIDGHAFFCCSNLASITIGNSVTKIGDFAFSCCDSLTSVTISDNVTTIDSSAFSCCTSLENVIIGNSVTTIGDWAFERCTSLKSVTIPYSVTTIGDHVFYDCTSLNSIYILNPNCSLGQDSIYSNSTIHTPPGSTVQKYAESNGIAFVAYCLHKNTTCYEEVQCTCKDNGFTAGIYCNDCGNWISGHEIIQAKHSNVIKGSIKLSTCHTYGYSESDFCNDCQSYITPKTTFPLTHVDNDNDSKCDECKNAIISDAVEIKTDLIRVIYTPQHYTGNEIEFEPVVVYENTILKKDVDYTLYLTDNIYAGNRGSLTVKGKGDYNFINKTVNFNILTADISGAEIADIPDMAYYGFACEPELNITFNGKVLKKNRDYVVQCINNCKPGVATVRVIGKGNFSGFIEKEYNIIKKNIEFDSENIKLDDITSPGELYSSNNNLQFLGNLKSGSTYWLKKDCYATFSFNSEDYKTDGWCLSFYINDELIYSNDLKPDNSAVLPFSLPGKYKVVCEVEVDNGYYTHNYKYVNGQVILVKEWVSEIEKHSQTIDLMVYSEESLPAPKTLVAEVPILYGTKHAFVSLESQDKVLVDLDVDKWNTSDAKIATVDNGRVVFHKSGEVTISAQKGNLTATWTFDNEPLSLEGNTQLLNFNPETNEITVLYKNEILDVDDYVLSVRNVGKTTVVTVQGCNLFTGKVEAVFDTETGMPYYCEHKKSICSSSITRQPTCVESGVKRFICNCGICYTESIAKTAHTYKTSTTKATLSKNGKVENKCIGCGKVKSTTTIYSPKTFTFSTTKYVYDGKNKTPAVTVKDSAGKKLIKGTDYKLTVASKRSAIGRHTVKVTFMGNYSGTKNLYFYILPGKPATVKSAAQTSSAIKLTWSKVAGAAGYTVYRYSPSKKAYVKAGATTGTSYTVKKLLAGTKYTFRVVAYGKTSSGKVYNSESYALIKTATCTATPTVKLASTAKGRATVAWNNVSGETGYQVYYATSKNGTYSRIANYKANTAKIYKTGLKSGKTYYFKVRTYISTDSGYVYSPFSAVKSVKIK